MAKDEAEIQRLESRLRWEGAGPITDFSNQAVTSLLARLRAFTQSVRAFTVEHPLIGLLLAFQVGFFVGRRGLRRAKH